MGCAVGDRIEYRFTTIDIAMRARGPTRLGLREIIQQNLNFRRQWRFGEISSRSAEYRAECGRHQVLWDLIVG
jgi:hypothetical protein